MEYWAKQGVERFIIPLSASQSFIREYFGKQFRGTEISYLQLKRDLGDGGALLLALGQAIDPTVLILSGNYFSETDIRALQKAHQSNGADITL
jgi:NDP-sugar pyrophosphorylase family protein